MTGPDRPAAPWCDDPLCQCSSLNDHQNRSLVTLPVHAWLVDRLTAGELRTYKEIITLIHDSSKESVSIAEVRGTMFAKLQAMPESTLIGYAAFVDQALAHLQHHDAATLVASLLTVVAIWQ